MKNNARKLIALILTALVLVSLTACENTFTPSRLATGESSRRQTEEPPEKPDPIKPEAAENDDKEPTESDDTEDTPDPVEVRNVIVDINNRQVVKGAILTPLIAIVPAYATDKSFTLSSGDESVLNYTNGNWTAVGAGTTDLIATASNGVTGRVTITVTVPVEAVSLSESEITINPGESISLELTINPNDATDKHTTFTTSDANVATVSEDGAVLGVSPGTATITCVVGGLRATCTVTVEIPVASISVSTDKSAYRVGELGRITVSIIPEDASDKSFTTTFSNAGASLTGENIFSCDDGGEVTIIVTAANGMFASQTIAIIDLVAYATEVLRLTNIERANEGLPALGTTPELTQTAVVRAYEIIQSFSHDRPDGRSCFTAFAENGVVYSWAGENIAMGQRTPADVVRAWMNSPGHRENILKSQFNNLGVGVAMGANGRLYWSQSFTD